MSPSPDLPHLRFRRIVEDHVDAVWRVARRCGITDTHLDDIVQEVFLVVSRRLHEIGAEGERAFVVGATVRVSANWRRSLRRRLEDCSAQLDDPSSEPSPETFAIRRQGLQLLDSALDDMTDLQREVFVLTELEQLTAREVAEQLQIPEAAVVSRLRRAREVFKQFCVRAEQAPGTTHLSGSGAYDV